jgi:hypothetical protein
MKTQTTLILAALLISGCIAVEQPTTTTVTMPTTTQKISTTSLVSTTTTGDIPTTYGYIVGRVIPAKSNITVDLLKESSLMRTKVTDNNGFYSFYVPSADYALEFTLGDVVYVYNDETNSELYSGIYHNLKIKSDNTSFYNIDLSSEMPDFRARLLDLIFKKNQSENDILNIINSTGSKVIEKYEFTSLPLVQYTVQIPSNKSIFEMQEAFLKEGTVEKAELHKIATG